MLEDDPLVEKMEQNPSAEEMEHKPLTEKREHIPAAEEMEHSPLAEKTEHNPAAEVLEKNPLAEKMETLYRKTKGDLSVAEEEEGGLVYKEKEISLEDDEDEKGQSENEGQTTGAYVKQNYGRGKILYQHTIKKRKF